MRLPAPRAPFIPTSAGLSAGVATSLAPPAVPRRLQGVVPTTCAPARYARLAQTQRLHLGQHAILLFLLFLIALLSASKLRKDIVSGLVFVPVCLLLFVALAPLWVRSHVVVQQRRDKRIWLRRPHRGTA
jgi:hypothetical protein